MDRICICIAYNGKWTTNNKYLDHETKLALVNGDTTFKSLVGIIFHVLKLESSERVSNIWFDTKLQTSKGMLVTNDDEVTTCIYLLKNDPNFKTCRFIVDFAGTNSSLPEKSSNAEVHILHEVNIEHQEEGVSEMDIVVEPAVDLEFRTPERTKEKEHTSIVKKLRRRSRSKRNNLPNVMLGENASLDEIVAGSMFQDKESLKKCFSNNAIKYNFQVKVRKSSKTTYWLKCYYAECGWYMHSSKFKDTALFRINKFDKTHSCSVDEQHHVTPKVISDHIIELLHESKVKIRPNFVVEEVMRRFGLNISYHKARRAIQRALAVIRGRPEEIYELPPGCNSLYELPPGWKEEVIIRQSDRGPRKYPFYTDPVHGYVFRTKKEVFRYLQSGDTSRCVRKPPKKNAASSTKDNSMVLLSGVDDKHNAMHLPEGVVPFIHIDENEFLGRKQKMQNEEDIAICECKYDASDPDSACGARCLNVLTYTECTPGYCNCGPHCRNQRFQRREYAKTKLFKTKTGRGWGLLADEDIKAGQFIIEYCGEVISSEEAMSRSQTYGADGLKDAYVISLDANDYFIDATWKGSNARFINHSCEPNCETRKWRVLGETRVGIFAKQDICAGTELGYNYNFEWYGGETVRCLCGAENCCVFLGAKSQGYLEYNDDWEHEDDPRYIYDPAEHTWQS